MTRWYRLDANHRVVGPVEIGSGDTWARVDETVVGSVRVSTVFLGLDHRYSGEGPPVVFETMTFPDDAGLEQDCERYCTWDEAVAGHAAMVELVKKRSDPDPVALSTESKS